MNKLENVNGFFNGMNLNPIPLEFGQSISTGKNLAAMLKMIDDVITFMNGWYDEILSDLENNGRLYQELNTNFISSFGADISTLQTSVLNINNLLTTLQYTKPSVTLTTSPTTLIYSVGETINSIMLNFNIAKGTDNLIKAEIYKNGSLLTTINTPINGINNYVDGAPITTDTEYYIKVFDDKGFVTSETIKFKFVYKMFYGKVASSTTINDAFIQTLNNVNFDDSFNFNISSLNDEKIIIVSHDLLSSVIDSDNYDFIESFTISDINLNINSVSTPYKIYTSTNTIFDSNVVLNIIK